jgi:hypothetical protein
MITSSQVAIQPRQRTPSGNGNGKSGKPPRSWLAAVLCGLINYLETNTPVTWTDITASEANSIRLGAIDWKYYDSRITPNMGAKGGVRILKTNGLDFDKELNNLNWREKLITVQIRILVADTQPLELECLLCDWEEYIDNVIDLLKPVGITGVYRDVELHSALMGIQNSPRGNTFASDETPGAQGSGSKQYTGIFFGEYVVPYEKDIHNNTPPVFW